MMYPLHVFICFHFSNAVNGIQKTLKKRQMILDKKTRKLTIKSVKRAVAKTQNSQVM